MLMLLAAACAQTPGPSVPVAQQIAAAVQAAPADRRESAAVLGYGSGPGLDVLRKGTNDLECIADTPGDEAFRVSCYHTSLAAYMRRGRELAAEGVTDRNERRWAEVKAGTLAMPDGPATLYVLSGSGWV